MWKRHPLGGLIGLGTSPLRMIGLRMAPGFGTGTAEFTDYGSYGIAARIGLFAYSVCFYPLKLVWPADLSPLYEVPSQVSLLDPRFLLPLVALLVVTSVLLALRRRAPGALAAWAHSAAFVAPVGAFAAAGAAFAASAFGVPLGAVWLAPGNDSARTAMKTAGIIARLLMGR